MTADEEFDASGVITLTSDFGLQDPFVGVMKGQILRRFPDGHDRRPDPRGARALAGRGWFLARAVVSLFPAGHRARRRGGSGRRRPARHRGRRGRRSPVPRAGQRVARRAWSRRWRRPCCGSSPTRLIASLGVDAPERDVSRSRHLRSRGRRARRGAGRTRTSSATASASSSPAGSRRRRKRGGTHHRRGRHDRSLRQSDHEHRWHAAARARPRAGPGRRASRFRCAARTPTCAPATISRSSIPSACSRSRAPSRAPRRAWDSPAAHLLRSSTSNA